MSQFIIECPKCHKYVEANTGLFARKKVNCSCGYVIDIKADRMTTRECPSCGNTVVFDQAKGTEAKCPICHSQLITNEDYSELINFRCTTCGCNLQAAKSARSIVCPMCNSTQDVQVQVKLQSERSRGIPSVIRHEGDNNSFVWKHPNTDFVTGTQLLVHESQEAIFFRNGEALDSFGPGRYTLETSVMPKMNKLYPLPIQGNPFHAEVYFVNLTTQMGIKWGTNSKVGLLDPITGVHIELGASGSFNLRVTEPRKLVIQVVGTSNALSRDQIFSGDMSYFRTMIMTKVKGNLARVIKENHISALELDERVEQISAALKDAINVDLGEYGLTMPEFYVSNIVTPDDDPNFARIKQQRADEYLKVREEQIKKAEAEAALERKAVEAQAEAKVKVIGAQGDADVTRIKAAAEAEAYRLQAEAEAQEMRMKGYTYQQETARQVGVEAMKNPGGGVGGVGGIAGDAMKVGIGLGAVGSVIGMTKEVIQPAMQSAGAMAQQMSGESDGWTCTCGKTGITSKFCPECGNKKPEPPQPWNCTCGQTGIISNFCPNCGKKRSKSWDCSCGKKGITTKFCPECGKKRED